MSHPVVNEGDALDDGLIPGGQYRGQKARPDIPARSLHVKPSTDRSSTAPSPPLPSSMPAIEQSSDPPLGHSALPPG